MCIYIHTLYIYIPIHTHTHIYIYIYTHTHRDRERGRERRVYIYYNTQHSFHSCWDGIQRKLLLLFYEITKEVHFQQCIK